MLLRGLLALTAIVIVTTAVVRATRRPGGGGLPATWHDLAASGGAGHGISVLIAGAAALALVLLRYGTAPGSTEVDPGE